MKKMVSMLLVALLMIAMSTSFAMAEEPITLSVMVPSSWIPGGDVSAKTGEVSVVVTDILAEFEKRCPNVTLEFESLNGGTDGYNSYLLRGASGTLPDISYLDGYWIAAFASQGYTYPMEGRIDQAILDDYYDAFKMTYQGETHGLVTSTAYNGVLWYRESMLKQAGYDTMPTDYDEFWQAIRAMAIPGERYGTVMSAAITEATTCSLLGMYWAGEDVFVDDNNVAQFNNETSLRIFNTFKDLYDEGVVPNELLTLDYDGAQTLFTSGQSASLIHGSWQCTAWDYLTPDFADDISLALLPADPKTGIQSQNAGGWSLAITTPDTTKDEAINVFFDLMLTNPDFATLRLAEDGELPVTKTIGSMDVNWLPEKYVDTIMSVLPTAKTRPVVSAYPTASEYYDIAFQEAVSGEKTPEQALEDAVKNVAIFVEDSGF